MSPWQQSECLSSTQKEPPRDMVKRPEFVEDIQLKARRSPGYSGDPETHISNFLKIYGRCSQHYLQIYYSIVNTNGKFNAPLVNFKIESAGFGGRIRIQSAKFEKYVCFNRRRIVTARYDEERKSRRCVFVERMNKEGYTQLESAWRPGLFLGFNRKGRFMSTRHYYNSKKRKCFDFLKVTGVEGESHSGGLSVQALHPLNGNGSSPSITGFESGKTPADKKREDELRKIYEEAIRNILRVKKRRRKHKKRRRRLRKLKDL